MFHFSTLSTKLPHDKVQTVLYKFIDICFDEGENNFILRSYFRACWVKQKINSQLCFNKKDSNCYFTMGKKIFSQIIGISMGSDPASFFANLFLYFCESRWIKDLQKKDLMKTRKLCNIYWLINDLNAINDAGIFENNFRGSYPEELELCREIGNNAEAIFLDLGTKIKNNTFQICLFDKRDSFPFSIVRIPRKCINIS